MRPAFRAIIESTPKDAERRKRIIKNTGRVATGAAIIGGGVLLARHREAKATKDMLKNIRNSSDANILDMKKRFAQSWGRVANK